MIEINNISILGSGTLGLRVGLQAAISKYNVTIYDIKEEILDNAKGVQLKILKSLVKKDLLEENQIDEIVGRIKWTTDLKEACSDADLINESVTEDLAIKQTLWKKVGESSPDKTIFTTNTSYLLPSMMCEESGRPDKFCAFHFHDVFWANVVDIMPHPGTNQEIIELLFKVGERLNQTPVLVKKESSGYIFNSILIALIGAAGILHTKDIASVQDIDRSWMGNFKMEMGPFGILDTVGLDTAWHIVKVRTDPKSKAFAELLKTYIDEGKLGTKTGEGFYKYPNPVFKESGFIKGIS